MPWKLKMNWLVSLNFFKMEAEIGRLGKLLEAFLMALAGRVFQDSLNPQSDVADEAADALRLQLLVSSQGAEKSRCSRSGSCGQRRGSSRRASRSVEVGSKTRHRQGGRTKNRHRPSDRDRRRNRNSNWHRNGNGGTIRDACSSRI